MTIYETTYKQTRDMLDKLIPSELTDNESKLLTVLLLGIGSHYDEQITNLERSPLKDILMGNAAAFWDKADSLNATAHP